MSGRTEDKNSTSTSGRSYGVCMKVNVPGQQRGRRAGSLEPMDTIFVKQVKEGGPAERAGLRTGDRIVSVNGESVTGKTYSQVIALIQSSDSSLKLLVVPRDEDILQMAYQNSAYNQGQEPYKGHACEIPEPPALRGQKSGMAPRFKSELSVMPEEEHREVHEPLVVGTIVDHAYSAPPQIHPPTPVRSSSKNVVLSHIQNMGGHSPSSESSVNNYSDSSVTSSTDNQPSQNGQSAAAKSRAPYLQYRPTPYTRSQTTSSLQQQQPQQQGSGGPGDRSNSSSTSSLPSSLPSQGRSNSLPVSHLFTSSTYVEPYSNQYEGSSYVHQPEDFRTSHNVDTSSPSKSRWTHHSISAADPNKMGGGTVTVRFHDSRGGVQQMELPRYGSGQDRGPGVVISTGRHSISDQYGINLVSERMRKFDSADSIDSSGRSQRYHVNLGGTPSDVPTMGIESVASRIAQYETTGYSDGSRSDDERFRPRRYSADDQQRSRYGSPLAQAKPPNELSEMTSSPPATISIYFRSDHVPSPTTKVQPSPERLLRQAKSQDRDLSVPIDRMSRDRSPLGPRDQYFSPPYMRRTNKVASRQPSYLTAVNAPHSQGSQSQSAPPSLTVSAELDSWQPGQASSEAASPSPGAPQNSLPEVVGSTASSTSTVIGGATVVMRQQSTPEDREAKLFRRTSYMMATGKDNAPQLGGMGDVQHEMSKSDSHLLPNQGLSPTVMIEPVTVEEVHCAPPPLPPIASSGMGAPPIGVTPPGIPPMVVPPIAVPEIIEDTIDGGPPGEPKKKLSVDLSAAKQVPDESKDDNAPATPPKVSNIRKLKYFFGEKTPRIHEVTTDRSRIFDMPKPGETVKEGMLFCKMAIADGKKAADRSWKPMWVLLKGHALYLFKDKASASSSSPTGGTEEHPISIKSCMVDIAYDYTKRKNVFRLTTYNGSEYLFQTEDHDSMIDWIRAIQANNDPDEDVQNKLSKTLPSKTALRSKSPASHSPSIRQKKTSDKDHVESPKGKDGESKGNRTWKGRMAKKFKRYGSSSSAPAEADSETADVTGTFCVHLELTPPSTFSEFIPSVVELCTRVVEDRGLEVQGIYRVPGNTGAVNILQEEINKDPYGQDIDCDKWLDVNVVSSLLKSFFRKLPESLITDDLYEHIIAANRTDNPEKRMLKIKKVLHELPDHNFETFRYVAQHLYKVSEMGAFNKMYARNLAIVFGPTLVRKKDESMVSMVKDMSDQCRIVESIIMHPDWFFSSWDVDDHVPIDNDGEEGIPVSGMNQELLTKAEHLELGERGKDLSAKDLVSSIISAANRKKKKVPTATLR